MKMKKILPVRIIETSSFSERRLIMYLFGRKGINGILQKNEKSKRYQGLMSLVGKNIVNIVKDTDKHVYFKFADNFQYKKISVSFGRYIE